MSTKALVGYKDENGNFRGTSVNFDGDLAGEQLNEMMGGDRPALIRWVEKGIAETGYRDLDETYNDEDEPVVYGESDVAGERRYGTYVWLINESGIVIRY